MTPAVVLHINYTDGIAPRPQWLDTQIKLNKNHFHSQTLLFHVCFEVMSRAGFYSLGARFGPRATI